MFLYSQALLLPCRWLSKIAFCHFSKQLLELDSWPAQAQGLWRMLQGKPKDEREEQAQRAQRERQEKLKIDDEWASRGKSGKLCA